MDNIYTSKKKLLVFLNIKENFLYHDFCKKYTEKEILKKNGKIRKIKPPAFNLKVTQRLILDKILQQRSQLECVYGLSKNKNVIANALFHQENILNCMITLDIEDFFPNIYKNKVFLIFKKLGFNKENSSILTKICTVENSLPQGAPTSPFLASLVCEKMDKAIYNYCQKRKFKYTRYFDDITVSGKNITNKNIKDIENFIIRNKFKSNETKKRFFDFDVDKLVNGVLISKHALSVPQEYKEEIKRLYSIWKNTKDLQIQKVYRGKLAFYLYINKKEATEFVKSL